jgi:hypothetical protein
VSSFRDYIIGLVNDVKTEADEHDDPAAAAPDGEQQQREDAARDGELDNRGTDQEIHDAEIVDGETTRDE